MERVILVSHYKKLQLIVNMTPDFHRVEKKVKFTTGIYLPFELAFI